MVTATRTVVGQPVPRQEGPDKVTGRIKYSADVALPGMLFGKLLRSPYPHARIVSIDASGAWEVPGVRAVLTGKDIPNYFQGKRLRDMPVLAWDRVRFIGDRVAAVAADTAEAAEEALNRIEVEYEELPAIFDPLEAMKPDALRVHDNVRDYEGSDQLVVLDGSPNAFSVVQWTKGDVEAGFKQADLVLEHTFRTPSRHTGYIEPHAGSLYIDDEGRIQVYMASKSPFGTRSQLANAIGVPESQIRINPVNVGGDFGGKGDAMDLPIAYFLAKRTGKPVLMLMNYIEELMAGNPSHPSVVTIKTGITKDGRMVARTLTAIHDSGAYGAMKPVPTVSIGGASHGGGPYRVDNVFFEAIQVYTNTVPRGFFRAPGAPQINFAVEQHMDLLAEALGMDPAEFRLKNVLQTGDTNPLGHKMRDVQAEPVLRGALDAVKWNSPPGKNRGRGISMYERHILGGMSSAIINAEPDGSLTLVSPTYDQGVGTHVVISQIVAEFLQVPLDTIKVVISDTDSIPPDGGVGGARVTNGAGNAFFKAATELLDKLKSAAADRFECPVEEIVSERGELFPREDPRRRLSFAEAIRLAGNGSTVNVTTTVNIPLDNSISGFAAQIAEVEVDPETGEFKIVHFVSAHDVGQIMNPITHQGQIDGGVVQAIGMGIMEEMPIDEGRVTTLHLGDYKLPTIADIPPLTTVLVPAEEGPAPFAGKAIGEMANVPGPAAIANAVAAAVGVRIMELPVTAEKIYFALYGKEE